MIRAEFTKFRSVRAWVAGLVIAVVVVIGLGALAASGVQQSCMDQKCPLPPTGPGGEVVRDTFSYVHQTLTGDGDLTAHVASFTGIITYPPPNHDQIVDGLVPWAKAGIMVKDGTSPGSSYASVLLTGAHGVRMQHDFTADEAGPSAATWLRLSRSGSSITGYASADGNAWTKVGTARVSARTATIGLFVASPSDVTTKASPQGGSIVQARFTQATAVFDHVSRTGAWTFTNVGDDGVRTDWEKVNQPPGFTQDQGRITVSGSGDIAPGGHEAGPSLELTLAGIIAGLIAVIIVAVLFITGEYRRGLILTTFTAMPNRGRVLAAKAVVIGVVTFVTGLIALAVTVPLALRLVHANDVFVLPTSVGTRLRVIVGAALLLSFAAVLAYSIGAFLRRGILAVAAAIVLVVVPYLLAATSILPSGAGQWLLRLTPAAGFAVQQTLPAYYQVQVPHTPSEGYYPLPPWAGLAVLAAWALGMLGLAVLRSRR
jgi:hypothetical protein